MSTTNRNIVSVIFMFALLMPKAFAQETSLPSWNAFAVIKGRMTGDGFVFACEDAEADVDLRNMCWRRNQLIAQNVGPAKRMSLNEVFDRQVRKTLPPGLSAKVVGLGPTFVGHIATISSNSLVLYYNLSPQPSNRTKTPLN